MDSQLAILVCKTCRGEEYPTYKVEQTQEYLFTTSFRYRKACGSKELHRRVLGRKPTAASLRCVEMENGRWSDIPLQPSHLKELFSGICTLSTCLRRRELFWRLGVCAGCDICMQPFIHADHFIFK